jgi:hypothetical protein
MDTSILTILETEMLTFQKPEQQAGMKPALKIRVLEAKQRSLACRLLPHPRQTFLNNLESTFKPNLPTQIYRFVVSGNAILLASAKPTASR